MRLVDELSGHSLFLTNGNLHKWESVLNTPSVLKNQKTVTVSGAKGNAYKGNFYALIKNELGITEGHWYITLRINKLKSPTEYDGGIHIKIIDPAIVDVLLDRIESA